MPTGITLADAIGTARVLRDARYGERAPFVRLSAEDAASAEGYAQGMVELLAKLYSVAGRTHDQRARDIRARMASPHVWVHGPIPHADTDCERCGEPLADEDVSEQGRCPACEHELSEIAANAR